MRPESSPLNGEGLNCALYGILQRSMFVVLLVQVYFLVHKYLFVVNKLQRTSCSCNCVVWCASMATVIRELAKLS